MRLVAEPLSMGPCYEVMWDCKPARLAVGGKGCRMLILGYKTGPRDMECHISSGRGPGLEVEPLQVDRSK